MRFMLIAKSTPETEAGVMPSSDLIARMGRFNEELIGAGILLAAEGLQPSSKGAKIRFDAGRTTVTDGPFAEAKEVVGGFWILQVKDRDEALAWARRVPMQEGDEMELMQVFEVADFPADSVTEEHLRKEQEWRDANQKPLSN
ncbi:MAG: YciI family protein [Devosia sp.]|nr:YciI family protein [Devosia sp.]